MLGSVQYLFNENIIRYLQSIGNPFFDKLFLAITTIGSQPAYILLASLIFWCFNKKAGIRAMYVVIFSAFIAILAKNLFNMPRPPEALRKIEENEFGFPSGHALVSSGFWGYLVASTKSKLLLLTGFVLIFLISFSRVYLGVHYLGDVVGGIILGLAMALIFFKVEPRTTNELEKMGRASRYSFAILLPLILAVIAYVQKGLAKEQVEIALVMAGIGVGYLLEEENISFEDTKNNRQRIRRALVGVAVLSIVYLLSAMLLLIDTNFEFLKFAALGFSSTFLAPWAFVKVEALNIQNRPEHE